MKDGMELILILWLINTKHYLYSISLIFKSKLKVDIITPFYR